MLRTTLAKRQVISWGFFYRTIRIVENGIKPAYVFDGKPPSSERVVCHRHSASFCCSRLAAVERYERREEAKDRGRRSEKEIGLSRR